MNKVLDAIAINAQQKKSYVAYKVYSESEDKERFIIDELKWSELEEYSNRLAGYINEHTNKKEPIVVYGHKSKYMLVCFIACVKSGHAYVPVDISVPDTRVKDIIETVSPEMVFAVEELSSSTASNTVIVDRKLIEDIALDDNYSVTNETWLDAEDVFYIIFTSGSTGKPKGVQITTECLANYVEWGKNLGGMESDAYYRFLNQAPFSFDLSVMDVYLSLYTGGTICAITKEVQSNLKLLYKALKDANVNVWVSTPSFADVCLSDRIYNEELLPELGYFLFCGEILTNKTVEKLKKAFSSSVIVNTYGPTESTVCVTEVIIDNEIENKYSPLPVGAARPGTWLYIVDENGNALPDGEQGEIIIVGDTVSTGYYKNDQQTKKAFSTKVINNQEYRLYRTGDKGYLINGQLFYCGRIDFQIKLHGYRIEIEDIENNLLKVDGVDKAVVLPNTVDGKVKSLTAYVIYNGAKESDFETSKVIKMN